MSQYQTKKGIAFEAELRKYMKLRGITTFADLRAHTSIGSQATICKYFDDPELIPVGKLREMLNALRIPREDRQRIINIIAEGDN